ncbi:hypothetical protein CO058_04150 [candidate division WWE3 bacterium CG_4_9_14_0_2_um_filter_35_11]|uniref:CMP/dCMP-type deaminase domain-containing protein n=1 Tax=candidate division WWE3 bacterium CG_4_9_14_0_2_um_filter_35_11 TaxID=1975077 RepID=A0A2M8EKS1_UNCKA|nr:MAG: hypothetical protein COV25_03415 [candidate division WWE3 bacterium CG10_big_fil_rev_8_21_14_0_10_35_32]PJC23328.1 MAG: hypothetical protein CO058_04150 [candidate division WWE3 bacterium CG_4_9_14_0_2_um_filter_35_11]
MQKSQITDFLKKAAFIADNSTCGYKIGCVGVVKDIGQKISPFAKKDPQFRRKDGFIYLKTWNETLKGEIFCQTCDKNNKRICIREVENLKGKDIQKVCSIHAEANLIAKCAKYGIQTPEMTIFLTNSPCYICAKSIIQAGIKKIYYISKHTDTSGIEILCKNSIPCEVTNF